MKNKVTDDHLKTMATIVDFIQSLGWDVQGIEIRRFCEDEDGEEWKKTQRWYLDVTCLPTSDNGDQNVLVKSQE